MIHLVNKNGARVILTEHGAGVVSVVVPDKNGVMGDVALGYMNENSYIGDGPCAGKIPGRFANRIAAGHFTLDGKDYQLPVNNGPNHLHGGINGFADLKWKCEQQDDSDATFSLISPDGDNGYPGELRATAKYSWNDQNELILGLSATTNATTILNLTNHTYWNLAGEDSGTVLNHKLQIEADSWLPTDENLIPTGEIVPVAGTPMDFRTMKTIGRDIKQDFPVLKFGKGYDNCWVLHNEGSLQKVAELQEEISGRKLEVWTDQPAMQVYTGNWLSGSPVSKSGRSYNDYDGVAIECQNFPDAPNHPNFPSAVLRPGETYRRTIIFKLGLL